VVPAAIEVVGGVRIAEHAGQPQAQVARVDRHDDVAVVVDHILQRRQRIAALTQHRVLDQALLAAQVAAVEGHANVIAGGAIVVSCGCSGSQARGASLS